MVLERIENAFQASLSSHLFIVKQEKAILSVFLFYRMSNNLVPTCKKPSVMQEVTLLSCPTDVAELHSRE